MYKCRTFSDPNDGDISDYLNEELHAHRIVRVVDTSFDNGRFVVVIVTQGIGLVPA